MEEQWESIAEKSESNTLRIERSIDNRVNRLRSSSLLSESYDSKEFPEEAPDGSPHQTRIGQL
jgi:hypothetical protein